MPTPKLIAGWRAQVPPDFRFTLEGAEAHHARQAAARRRSGRIGATASSPRPSELGPQLAALLFQLPPNFKKDLGLLNEFLVAAAAEDDGGVRVPQRVVAGRRRVRRAAGAEHRAVHRRQRDARDADRDDRRLRLPAPARRRIWRRRHRASGPRPRRQLGDTAKDVFVYFKHEDEGKGAAFGQQMMKLLGQTMTISDLRSRIADQLKIAGCVIAAAAILAGCNQPPRRRSANHGDAGDRRRRAERDRRARSDGVGPAHVRGADARPTSIASPTIDDARAEAGFGDRDQPEGRRRCGGARRRAQGRQGARPDARHSRS